MVHVLKKKAQCTETQCHFRKVASDWLAPVKDWLWNFRSIFVNVVDCKPTTKDMIFEGAIVFLWHTKNRIWIVFHSWKSITLYFDGGSFMSSFSALFVVLPAQTRENTVSFLLFTNPLVVWSWTNAIYLTLYQSFQKFAKPFSLAHYNLVQNVIDNGAKATTD